MLPLVCAGRLWLVGLPQSPLHGASPLPRGPWWGRLVCAGFGGSRNGDPFATAVQFRRTGDGSFHLVAAQCLLLAVSDRLWCPILLTLTIVRTKSTTAPTYCSLYPALRALANVTLAALANAHPTMLPLGCVGGGRVGRGFTPAAKGFA